MMSTLLSKLPSVNNDTVDLVSKLFSQEFYREEPESDCGFMFLSLPTELKMLVIYYLDPIDLLNLSLTSKEMHKLNKKNYIWKSLVLRHCDNVIHPPPNWKKYFYLRKSFFCKNKKGMLEWIPWKNSSALPSPRQSLTATYVNDKIYYIGGQTSITTRYDEIHTFDPETRTFTKAKVIGKLPKFARHTACSVGSKIYVFGGYDGYGTFYGLSCYDVETFTWTQIDAKGPNPIPRTNHAVTSVGTNLYLFGGNDTTKKGQDYLRFGTYGDFQVYDTLTNTWFEPEVKGKIPCPRSGHLMIPVGHKIYLFGGGLWNDKTKSWFEKYNDMFVFDTLTMEWIEVKQAVPAPHVFISLPHWGIDTFLFVYCDPVWCFDTVTLSWSQLKSKGPRPAKRFLGSAVAIPNKNSVYMFGGVYAQVMNNFDQLIWSNDIFEILKGESNEPDGSIS
jgi:N-acetylneuraminic acid mutarotase